MPTAQPTNPPANASPSASGAAPAPAKTQPSPPQTPAKSLPQPSVKKPRWIWFILMIILIAAGSSAGTMYVLNRYVLPKPKDVASEPPVYAGSVTSVEGLAWKVVDERKVEIKTGDTLAAKEEITTEENSRLVFALPDLSTVRIGASSSITLTTLTPNESVTQLTRGQVFARVNNATTNPFVVQSGIITVKALRGVFAVENTDEVKIHVFENKVTVVTDDKRELEVAAGQTWRESVGAAQTLSDTEVARNQFLTWSVTADQKETSPSATPQPTATKTPTQTPTSTNTPTPTVGQVKGFILSAAATDGGIRLSWEVGDLDVSKGFKVIKGAKANPSVPSDSSIFKDASTRSFVWDIRDGAVWHFRVCQYMGDGACGAYTNDVVVKAPK